MIIGLTGRNAAGKGSAANFFTSVGFIYESLSDELREVLKENGIPITRDNLIHYGQTLRRNLGPAFLAHRILIRLDPEKNYVVDSFRHPEEVRAFRLRKDFKLAAINANPETRFQRIHARNRESDPKTWEEFLITDSQETHDDDPMAQRIDKCEEMADVTFSNDSSLDDFYTALREWLRETLKYQQRPSWDDYFMQIAKVVALRSNCMKRKVAAIVVKDRRIISTGYNGTPRGVKNCYEGGCPRCSALGQSGVDLELCLCSHAEENAITQAAYHGIELKNATLYCTLSPCNLCAKMIINAGIQVVVYEGTYPLEQVSAALFKEAGVQLRSLLK